MVSRDNFLSSIFSTLCGCLLLVAALLTLVATPRAQTLVHSSGRSAGLAGAFTALARGPIAPRYNPANLGLSAGAENGIEFLSVGLRVMNNSLTLSDYNDYTGSYLSTADKQDILASIPADGLRVNAGVEANTLALAIGNYAFSLSGVGTAEVGLSKEIINLLLNGNRINESVEVEDSRSETSSYVTAGFSFGRAIYSSGDRQIAVGATIKYVKGLAIEKLSHLQGHVATTESGFVGEGQAVLHSAEGGRGYGLDIGGAWQLSPAYTVGVRVQNILGSIRWSGNATERGLAYQWDSTTVIELTDATLNGSEDWSKSIDGFTTTLPTQINAGLAKIDGKLLWSVDMIQGLEHAPGTSTKPLFAAGAEYALMKSLPVRAGVTVGGGYQATFAFGSGVRLAGFYVDAAVYTGATMSFYNAKGVHLAVSSGYLF